MIMDGRATLSAELVEEIRGVLEEQRLDGWLLFDFHGYNPVAGKLLGLGALSRRYFVLVPRTGPPVAVVHRIEEAPWADWPWETRLYLRWQELERHLADLLRGSSRVAMEYSPFDAVPYLDRVPAGVVELVRRSGPEVVGSAELVTRFHARWSADDRASHDRAARVVAESAAWLFDWIGDALRERRRVSEWDALEALRGRLRDRGLTHQPDGIVAAGVSGGDPHYGPTADRSRVIERGEALLIDCWGAEPGGVFADQTWMAFTGDAPPDDLRSVWETVRRARDRAVDVAREGMAGGRPIRGAELDEAAREVVEEAGYGEAFIHRTGHSIDRELHGAGPHLDSLETSDLRELVAGVGFSVEPGVYLPGRFGVRSEINVFLGDDGPVVTTPAPQRDLHLIRI